MVSDGGNQGTKVIGHAKGALLNLDKDLFQVGVDGVRAEIVVMAQVFHVLSKVSKQEDVAVADFTGDFNLSYRVNRGLGNVVGSFGSYIGAIACSDDETSVEDKLHVTCARRPIFISVSFWCLSGVCPSWYHSLCACSGNVLANIRGRDNHLGLADVVIFKENNLEEIANV